MSFYVIVRGSQCTVWPEPGFTELDRSEHQATNKILPSVINTYGFIMTVVHIPFGAT